METLPVPITAGLHSFTDLCGTCQGCSAADSRRRSPSLSSEQVSAVWQSLYTEAAVPLAARNSLWLRGGSQALSPASMHSPSTATAPPVLGRHPSMSRRRACRRDSQRGGIPRWKPTGTCSTCSPWPRHMLYSLQVLSAPYTLSFELYLKR